MPDNIELIAALVIPLLVLGFLRINAAMVFLSLCLGYVLVEFVANDTDSLISFIAPDANSLSASGLKLIMLFVPAVLTSVIMLFSVHGKGRAAFNVLSAAGVSVLAVLLAVPLLTPGLRYDLQSQSLWQHLNEMQAMVIGASALVSLVFLWSQRRHTSSGEHSKHRH